ncbi:MAG TPA: ATP-dependent helicase C-terminal domain-containing protein, partial [Desulfobacterales bacterium]|nr:ATP-dependent helicase C-terminal domain-containing protein [Desulfobacterales bacterium]
PMHPRLAHMVLAAMDAGAGAAACDLAALLSERDFVTFASGEPDSDLRLRLEIVRDLRGGKRPEAARSNVDRAACRRVIRLAEALRRRLGLAAQDAVRIEAGRLLAWAYPDRIGQRRPGAAGRYRLTNGRGAFFAAQEPLSASDYIVAADLDGERREARIFLAAAYDLATLLDQYAGQVHTREILDWDARRQAVVAERELRLGELVLKSEPLSAPDPAGIASALIKGIKLAGIGCLPWTQDARRWQARVMFVRRVGAGGPEWPDVSDVQLAGSLEEWLGAHLFGITRLADLKKVDLHAALAGMLDWRQRRALDELAPTHLMVPSGSRIRLDYSGETPVLAVRIQEMFGGTDTPRVGGGQPVLLHLLSPAGRPMQVTADLAGFWARGYPEVKKDLKGRYPKHSWPDDPLHATPTRRTKKR